MVAFGVQVFYQIVCEKDQSHKERVLVHLFERMIADSFWLQLRLVDLRWYFDICSHLRLCFLFPQLIKLSFSRLEQNVGYTVDCEGILEGVKGLCFNVLSDHHDPRDLGKRIRFFIQTTEFEVRPSFNFSTFNWVMDNQFKLVLDCIWWAQRECEFRAICLGAYTFRRVFKLLLLKRGKLPKSSYFGRPQGGVPQAFWRWRQQIMTAWSVHLGMQHKTTWRYLFHTLFLSLSHFVVILLLTIELR